MYNSYYCVDLTLLCMIYSLLKIDKWNNFTGTKSSELVNDQNNK